MNTHVYTDASYTSDYNTPQQQQQQLNRFCCLVSLSRSSWCSVERPDGLYTREKRNKRQSAVHTPLSDGRTWRERVQRTVGLESRKVLGAFVLQQTNTEPALRSPLTLSLSLIMKFGAIAAGCSDDDDDDDESCVCVDSAWIRNALYIEFSIRLVWASARVLSITRPLLLLLCVMMNRDISDE